MSETKKQKFQHIAVNGKKETDGTKYAEDLTKAMNKLAEEGYTMQLNEYEHFTVIIGVLVEERPVGARAVPTDGPHLRLVRVAASPEDITPSPRTLELMNRFQSLVDGVGIEAFGVEAKKQAARLAEGFNTEELSTAINEVERLLAEHEKDEGQHECTQSRSLRAVAEALRGVVQLQMQ